MTGSASTTQERTKMETLLAEPILARMATADPQTCQPHVVPVWFYWDGKSIWISSFSSTRKIRELTANPQISIIVDSDDGDGNYRSVLLEGTAELVTGPKQQIIEMSTIIYKRYLGEDGVLKPDPQSWIHDDENMLIKLTPSFQKYA